MNKLKLDEMQSFETAKFCGMLVESKNKENNIDRTTFQLNNTISEIEAILRLNFLLVFTRSTG